ncbi:unnamed protein product [Adineta ricciae]|uniref:protein-tyrosine-phosphatase n=1 Tax=Adineta ricciae TaxID=249248 RepID=A0A816GTW7_ADIRI|nr:unnamed protein product [Adineta ricciae]
MEEKNGDNEERRDSEQLTIRQNKSYNRRPLSNRTSDNHQVNRNSRRSVTVSVIDDEPRHRPMSRRSEYIPSSMRSSTSTQHISNPFTAEQQQQQQQAVNDEETSTYSFRHVTKKLQHAKSHGELYQPHPPLPLPPMTKVSNDENEIKYRIKHSSNSPQISSSTRARSATTTIIPILTRPIINSSDETFSSSSSSNKIPLWKRFKQMIVPTKRSKDSAVKTSSVPLSESSTNDQNRTVVDNAVTNNSNHHHNQILKNPIKIQELRSWLNPKSFPEQRIRDEYEKLPTESLHPKTLAFRPENKSKNRFNAIEPYDHSRVILRPLISDPSSDYINASYIDGYRASKLYIAAQDHTALFHVDFIEG